MDASTGKVRAMKDEGCGSFRCWVIGWVLGEKGGISASDPMLSIQPMIQPTNQPRGF